MNYSQELYDNILKAVRTFDGEAISETLQSLGTLVKGFIPTSSGGSLRMALKLVQGNLEIDTLYVITSSYDAHIIKAYALQEWSVDKVSIIAGNELEGVVSIPGWESNSLVAVRLYWDISKRRII